MHVILALEYTFVTNAPIISAAGFRQWAAGAADPLASRPTVVSRQALADHYFLLGWYVEIAPLAL